MRVLPALVLSVRASKLTRMTDFTAPNGLAVRDSAAPLAPAVASSFGLPDNFGDQLRLAELVAKSDLVDKKLQGNAANVFMVVQKAIGLNISFDLAVAKTHVIDNKVTPSAELLRILLRRAGHDLEIEHNDKAATGVLTLAHRPNKPITMEFTIAKAQAAGYTNKPLWKSDPESMLVAALTRRMVRFHCPEVAAGLDLSDDTVGAEFDGGDSPARSGGPVRVDAERVADVAPEVDQADPRLERAKAVLDEALAAKDVATLTRLGKEARNGDLLGLAVGEDGVTLKDALMNRLHELESGAPAAG